MESSEHAMATALTGQLWVPVQRLQKIKGVSTLAWMQDGFLGLSLAKELLATDGC